VYDVLVRVISEVNYRRVYLIESKRPHTVLKILIQKQIEIAQSLRRILLFIVSEEETDLVESVIYVLNRPHSRHSILLPHAIL
jgi:hypothetical protein